MVSHRDERDSFDAFNTHSQACLLHPWFLHSNRGLLTSGSVRHLARRKPRRVRYCRPLRESIAPDTACNSTEQHCAVRDGAR